MDYLSWIEGIDGLASLYSFDIMKDGNFSEIRLMAVNKQNEGMLKMNPDAPEFHPGIPYRNYWMDLNFESFVYKCGSTKQPLYSYVNARGVWLKGFYLPIAELEETEKPEDVARTAFCLYVITYSDKAETEFMSQKSPKIANAVMEISIKLHEARDYYQDMAGTVGYIKEFCGAEKCSIFTVDRSTRKCALINERGVQKEYLKTFAEQMELTPYEIAEKWEEDLAMSDCLLLENLKVIEERDPVWHSSLKKNGIKNLILYAVRYNQRLLGFIWAANYDTNRMMEIKETLELSTFLLAAVVANHQLVSRLQLKSTIDELTQVSNRNALNDRLERLSSGEVHKPETMGVIFADLNGLKAVNDDQGHETGDMLLKRAAALLKIAFGGYDIYRAGGDEFVILCPDIEEEKVEEFVSRLKGLANNTPDVSFAVGTEFCTGEYDINKAIQTADDDMYKDKKEFYEQSSRDGQKKIGAGKRGKLDCLCLRAERSYNMKTIEELCKEIEASEALHKEVTEIGDSAALAEFLKKYDCEASAEEFEKFLSAHAQQEGELDDDAVEAVAGGTNPLFFPLTFKGFHKLMIGKGHILV